MSGNHNMYCSANELANELEAFHVDPDGFPYMVGEAITMLRQQQAEIEALKIQLHTTLTNRDLRTYDGKTEINNEPLALALRKASEK